MALELLEGTAYALTLNALDKSSGSPYTPGGTVYVSVRDATTGKYWDNTDAAWEDTEPTIGNLLTATDAGSGSFDATLPAALSSGLTGHSLRAQLLTTYTEGSEVLVSQVATLTVVASPYSTWTTDTSLTGVAVGTLMEEVWDDLAGLVKTGGPFTVLRHLQGCQRELARDAECFVRTEHFVTVADQSTYRLASTPIRIKRVLFDEGRLPWRPLEQLDVDDDTDDPWREQTATRPTYWTGPENARAIRLTPIPTGAGTAFTFSGGGLSPIKDGYRVTGADYQLAWNSGTPVFFETDDGTCTNLGAANNLSVEYAFLPIDLTEDTVVPFRYLEAFRFYALWRMARDEGWMKSYLFHKDELSRQYRDLAYELPPERGLATEI